MSERRMFAKSIVLSDAFLDMPLSTRCLYFTLGMLADDDGFIGSPKSIMRQCGATEDDMKVLLAKRFCLGFDSGIIVIKHWRINNYLQKDRHKDTTYLEELATLMLDEKGAYTEQNKECIQNVYIMDTQNSIDKNRLDKVNKERTGFIKPTLEEIKEYCLLRNNNINAEQFYNFYESKGWNVGRTTMKDWKACVRTWEARTPNQKSEQWFDNQWEEYKKEFYKENEK